MSALRLVLVTPRYWPLVGETEHMAAELAQSLRGAGAMSTIVTARWSSDWPPETVHRELGAVRLSPAPLRGWSTYRYMRALARWLRAHRHEMDVVYVMNVRHEAYAVLRAVRGLPVGIVLRAQADDGRWLESSLHGGRMRRHAARADAIVAPTEAVCRELSRCGFSPPRVQLIRNGVQLPAPRTAAGQHAARAALAEVNHSLAVPDYAPIAVAIGPLAEGRGLAELLGSWRRVAQRFPSARLWLIGDGLLREALHQRIIERELQQHVSMPGTFDELSEVLAAADVFLAPAPPKDGAQHLLEAMAGGLPVIAARGEEYAEFIEHGRSGLLVAADQQAWADAICGLFEAPGARMQYGERARHAVQTGFPCETMTQKHLELFQHIAATKRRGSG